MYPPRQRHASKRAPSAMSDAAGLDKMPSSQRRQVFVNGFAGRCPGHSLHRVRRMNRRRNQLHRLASRGQRSDRCVYLYHRLACRRQWGQPCRRRTSLDWLAGSRGVAELKTKSGGRQRAPGEYQRRIQSQIESDSLKHSSSKNEPLTRRQIIVGAANGKQCSCENEPNP